LKKVILTFLRIAAFFGVGLTILILLYNSQNKAYQAQCQLDGIPAEQCSLIEKIITDFQNADYFWIFIMLLCFMLSNVSRAIRWNMLLRPLGYRPKFSNAFHIIMVGYFANLGLPRLGEIVRAGALSRYEKIPAEKVMGTVVADRAIDVISLLLFVGLAFFLQFDTLWGWLSENAQIGKSAEGESSSLPWILLGMLLLLSGLGFVFRKRIIASSFAQKILSLVKGFYEGITSVKRVEKRGWFVFHSIFIWVMYYLMAYVCFFAFEPTSHLSPLAGLMVFVFGAFGIVIPSPGGMGTYHFLVMAALALYGVQGADAFSFANIVYFAIQILGNILFGLIGLIALPFINKNYHPTPSVV